MKPDKPARHEDSQVRFVFADGVMYFNQDKSFTYGDVARRLGALSRRGYARPLSIAVLLAAPVERRDPPTYSRFAPTRYVCPAPRSGAPGPG